MNIKGTMDDEEHKTNKGETKLLILLQCLLLSSTAYGLHRTVIFKIVT
jgi:hypothetical protein